jgi:hypothetical protein
MTDVISSDNASDMYCGGIQMCSSGVQFESRLVPLIVLMDYLDNVISMIASISSLIHCLLTRHHLLLSAIWANNFVNYTINK